MSMSGWCVQRHESVEPGFLAGSRLSTSLTGMPRDAVGQVVCGGECDCVPPPSKEDVVERRGAVDRRDRAAPGFAGMKTREAGGVIDLRKPALTSAAKTNRNPGIPFSAPNRMNSMGRRPPNKTPATAAFRLLCATACSDFGCNMPLIRGARPSASFAQRSDRTVTSVLRWSSASAFRQHLHHTSRVHVRRVGGRPYFDRFHLEIFEGSTDDPHQRRKCVPVHLCAGAVWGRSGRPESCGVDLLLLSLRNPISSVAARGCVAILHVLNPHPVGLLLRRFRVREFRDPTLEHEFRLHVSRSAGVRQLLRNCGGDGRRLPTRRVLRDLRDPGKGILACRRSQLRLVMIVSFASATCGRALRLMPEGSWPLAGTTESHLPDRLSHRQHLSCTTVALPDMNQVDRDTSPYSRLLGGLLPAAVMGTCIIYGFCSTQSNTVDSVPGSLQHVMEIAALVRQRFTGGECARVMQRLVVVMAAAINARCAAPCIENAHQPAERTRSSFYREASGSTQRSTN